MAIGDYYAPSGNLITTAQERDYAKLSVITSSITVASTNASGTLIAADANAVINIWGWESASGTLNTNGHLQLWETGVTAAPILRIGYTSSNALTMPIQVEPGKGVVLVNSGAGTGAVSVFYTKVPTLLG